MSSGPVTVFMKKGAPCFWSSPTSAAFPRSPGLWLFCLALPRGLPSPGLGRLAEGTSRPAADTWFPLSSLLWFQELLASGSGGAVGCGEPRANSGTAEQTELPTVRRYVPARPAPPLGPLPERLAGQGAGRWPLVVGAGEKRMVEAREALAFRTLKLGDNPPPRPRRGAWVGGASSSPYFLDTGFLCWGFSELTLN